MAGPANTASIGSFERSRDPLDQRCLRTFWSLVKTKDNPASESEKLAALGTAASWFCGVHTESYELTLRTRSIQNKTLEEYEGYLNGELHEALNAETEDPDIRSHQRLAMNLLDSISRSFLRANQDKLKTDSDDVNRLIDKLVAPSDDYGKFTLEGTLDPSALVDWKIVIAIGASARYWRANRPRKVFSVERTLDYSTPAPITDYPAQDKYRANEYETTRPTGKPKSHGPKSENNTLLSMMSMLMQQQQAFLESQRDFQSNQRDFQSALLDKLTPKTEDLSMMTDTGYQTPSGSPRLGPGPNPKSSQSSSGAWYEQFDEQSILQLKLSELNISDVPDRAPTYEMPTSSEDKTLVSLEKRIASIRQMKLVKFNPGANSGRSNYADWSSSLRHSLESEDLLGLVPQLIRTNNWSNHSKAITYLLGLHDCPPKLKFSKMMIRCSLALGNYLWTHLPKQTTGTLLQDRHRHGYQLLAFMELKYSIRHSPEKSITSRRDVLAWTPQRGSTLLQILEGFTHVLDAHNRDTTSAHHPNEEELKCTLLHLAFTPQSPSIESLIMPIQLNAPNLTYEDVYTKLKELAEAQAGHRFLRSFGDTHSRDPPKNKDRVTKEHFPQSPQKKGEINQVDPTNLPKCTNCGAHGPGGHSDQECPHQKRCANCGTLGHYRKDCSDTTKRCHRCYAVGHTHTKCPNKAKCRHCLKGRHYQPFQANTRPGPDWTAYQDCYKAVSDDKFQQHWQALIAGKIPQTPSPYRQRRLGNTSDKTTEPEIPAAGAEIALLTGPPSCLEVTQVEPVILTVDTGASNHSTHDLQLLVNVRRFARPTTLGIMADGSAIMATAQGSMPLQVADSAPILIDHVYYSPQASSNLLSYGKLHQQGWVVGIDGAKFQLRSHDGATLAEATLNAMNLFKINCCVVAGDTRWKGETTTGEIMAVHTDKHLKLQKWEMAHRRLGHIGAERIAKTLDIAIPAKHDLCEPCLLGKARRKPRTHRHEESRALLEQVHGDLVTNIKPPGRDPVTSAKNANLTTHNSMGEDHSGYLWAGFTQGKGAPEVQETFIPWLRQLQNIHGHFPKYHRFDNGKEFTALTAWCHAEGILSRDTAPHSPHQNGTSERSHQTIWNGVRTVLTESGLPPDFWPAAVQYTCWINNHTWHRKHSKSPSEAIGIKPANEIKEAHPFGCKAYAVESNKAALKKLDDRSKPGIYLGPSQKSKGHIFLTMNMKTSKVVDHCIFVEDEFPAKRDNPQTKTLETPELNLTAASYPPLPAPKNSREVTSHQYRQEYETAEAAELKGLLMGNVFKIVPNDTTKQDTKRKVKMRFVYAQKRTPAGEHDKFKARLVVCGYNQIAGVDYHLTYAETISPLAIRTAISMAYKSLKKPLMWAADATQAFKNPPIMEKVFVQPPRGVNLKKLIDRLSTEDIAEIISKTTYSTTDFEDANLANADIRLLKSLYGTKQSGHDWQKMLNEVLRNAGWVQNTVEGTIWTKGKASLLCYVDDIRVIAEAEEAKSLMAEVIEMAALHKIKIVDEGEATNFIGMRITQNQGQLLIDHEKKILDLAEKYISHEKPAKLPNMAPRPKNEEVLQDPGLRTIVGSLMHITTYTRPDVAYAVHYLAQFCSRTTAFDMRAAAKIISYLAETKRSALSFKGEKLPQALKIFTDASWGNEEEAKSRSGVAVYFGSDLIQWRSTKQSVTARSTQEAEMYAAHLGVTEAKIIANILLGYGITITQFDVYVDNQATIQWVTGEAKGKAIRHVDIKYFSLRNYEMEMGIKLNWNYIESAKNVADIFTKGITNMALFQELSSKLLTQA